MAEQGNPASRYKCDPVCGAAVGVRFFRRASASFSAAVWALAGAEVTCGLSFVGFSCASFPGGSGDGFPILAVVRRTWPFTNLYPSGCTHSPLTYDQPLADRAISSEVAVCPPLFFSCLFEVRLGLGVGVGEACSTIAKLVKARSKRRVRFISTVSVL